MSAVDAQLAPPVRNHGQRPYLIAITPAALLLSLLFVIPAIWAIYTSMTSLSLAGFGGAESDFIGFDNFRRLWNNPDFPKFVRNTVVFVLFVAIVGQTLGGLALAMLLNHSRKLDLWMTTPAYAAILIAWITPPVLAGFLWGQIFRARNGVLNSILEELNLPATDMLGNHAMAAVIIAETWRGIAFAMIIFLGSLQLIPQQLYEAARVDGASVWQRFRDHTLPSLKHVTALVLLMTTIAASGSFLLILQMTNGDPAYQTETIALYGFHTAFSTFEIGYGAAISVVILLINAICAILFLGLTGRKARA